MAITPDLAKILRKDEEQEVARLECAIDQFLAKNYKRNSGTVPTFSFDEGKIPSKRIVDELTQRYEKAGWTVGYGSGREGSYMQFSKSRDYLFD